MNDTQIRESLAVLSDAVVVPAPDAHAFESRVRRVRRRRTAARALTASLAVAGVVAGTSVVLDRSTPDVVADPATPTGDRGVPVLVGGRLTTLSDGGVLGEPGPEVARIVGSTGSGVVVLAADGSLARVSGEGDVRTLVKEPVRRAFLAGDDVTYQTDDGEVGVSGPGWSWTAQPTDGTLVAGGDDTYFVDGRSGLVGLDADGLFDVPLGSDGVGEVVEEVELGGDRIAVHTPSGVQFFADRGRRTAGLLGSSTGALSRDGAAYATLADAAEVALGARDGLRLLDPATGSGPRVPGPTAPAVDLLWTDADTLLVLTGDDTTRTLWRCVDGGTSCAVLHEDPTGSLELPQG